jgi:membrane-associated phospholipid phosphatase
MNRTIHTLQYILYCTLFIQSHLVAGTCVKEWRQTGIHYTYIQYELFKDINTTCERGNDQLAATGIFPTDSLQDTILFSRIENQKITRGERFSNIDLNSYLIKKELKQNISWSASSDIRLKFSIDTSGIASVWILDENWNGSDTITFKATYNNYLVDNQLVVFTILSHPFFDSAPIRPVRMILKTGVNDILNIVVSPLKWDSTDFIKFPLIVLGTYSLIIGDQSIHNFVSDNGSAKKNALMDLGTQYGEVSFSQLSSLAVLSYGLIFRDDNAVTIGLEIFESYFIANNITSIVKRTFGRRRPYENSGPYSFNSFPSRTNSINSFPSGHATLAFSLSSILAGHTNSPWLKALFYTAAGVTAVSRVYYSYHWFSDVCMGGAIGYLVGNYLIDMHTNKSGAKIHFDFDEEGRFSLKFNF